MRFWTFVPVIALIGLLSIGMWLQRDRLIMRSEAAKLSEQARSLRTEIQALSDKLAVSAADIARLRSAIESAQQDAEAKARAGIDNLARQIGDTKGLLAASEKRANDLADRLAVAEGKVRLAELSRADAERSAADDLRMAREVERRRSMQVVEHERDMVREKAALGRKIEEATAAELAARMAAKKLAEEKAALERRIETAKAGDGDTSQLSKEKEAVERKIEEAQAMAADTSRLTSQQEALKQKLGETDSGRDVEVAQGDGRIRVTVASRILFESGSDHLRNQGMDVLRALAQSVAEDNREVHVVGHTDNRLIRTKYQDRYPTNWDLAAARATTAARYLIDSCKISADRIVIHSHGATRPVASNDTEEGRAKNRRIEIIFVPAGTTKTPPGTDVATQTR